MSHSAVNSLHTANQLPHKAKNVEA